MIQSHSNLNPLKKRQYQLEAWSQELKQIVGSIIKELAGVKQENKESKGIIQKHAQELRDFKQHNNDNLDIIQNRFNKYEEISKKETALREDFEVFKKQVQKDLESNTFDWGPILTGVGILVAGVVVPLAVYYFQNKSVKPTPSTRTSQNFIPGVYAYDQKRTMWILNGTNGEKIISDDVITEIQEINHKIIDGTFMQSTSDEPVNPNIRSTGYITIAYTKDVLFVVPISSEGVVQPGPIRVLPCEWYPNYPMYSKKDINESKSEKLNHESQG